MKWFRSKLLLLLLLALLIVSVMPLIFVSVVGMGTYVNLAQKSINLNSSVINEHSLDAMQSQAAATANQMAVFLRQRNTDLRTLASLPRTSDAYLAFASAKQGEIWTLDPNSEQEIRFNLPLYRQIAFIAPDGTELIKIVTRCSRYPLNCRSMPSENLVNVSDTGSTTYGNEDYFLRAQALQPGAIYVGRPVGYYVPSVVSFKGAQLPGGQRFEGIIRFIMPVYESEGGAEPQLVGYVMLALDHTHILEFIQHIDPTADRPLPAVNPQSNNFAYIIGSDGAAIGHVEHSNIAGVNRLGEPVPPFTAEQPNGPGNFYEMGFLSPVFPELMDRALQRPQGSISRFDLRDDPKLARSLAYSVIPYFEGANYADGRGFGLLIISSDYNARSVGTDVLSTQLQNDLAELAGNLGVLLTLTLAVSVVIALLFAQRVVSPIRTVMGYAQIMEQRSLTHEEIAALKHKRGDSEVTQLARTFGTMAETVQQREGEIAELLSLTDEALTRRVRELSTLEKVGQQLTSTLDLNRVFEFATTALIELTAAEGVHLKVYPEEGSGEEALTASAGREITIKETIESLQIPLKHEGRVIGRFVLYARQHHFDENEQSFARQLADWVSVAVNNARLFRFIQEQQRQLEITNEEVMEANRMKSEFLAIMSHELRTPLNAIIGFLGIMVMSGQLNERNTYLAGRARANSDRLLRLINDILEISRIEAGRLQLYPAPIEIRELVKKLRDQMSVLADEKGLKLEIQIDNDVPNHIMADEDALTKVITNLLSNGFKFTEKGSVSLKISCKDENLHIVISDTGIGIPAHMHSTIFESFRQVDASMTRRHGGSGLGLAIVQHFCAAMQGTIQVSSTVGKGSTFTAILPLLEQKELA